MKENELRPKNLIDEYFRLCKLDIKLFFNNKRNIIKKCISCNSMSIKKKYIKDTFIYSVCLNCGTLFNSNRPSLKSFKKFYTDSYSSKYWSDVFFPTVMKIRKNKIFKPNAIKILNFLQKDKKLKFKSILDVGAGQGLLLDEFKKLLPNTKFLAIEPSEGFAKVCANKGYRTYKNIVENVKITKDLPDLVISNEVIEHVYSPYLYLKKIKENTKKNGIIFISTLNYDGFDLQILDQNSSQIKPPHHINFLSIQGFENIFKRLGLKVISIQTPGKMDVDIVKNSLNKISDKSDKMFLDFIFTNNLDKKFQKYLVDIRKSSHIWLFVKNV